MSDLLQRFIFEDQEVRGQILRLNKSYKEVLAKHPYPAQVAKVLGEILALSVMLSATIKFQGAVTLQIQGDGALSLLLAQCDNNQQFRGLAKWQGKSIGKDLAQAVGNGKLVITIQAQELKQPYQAVVDLTGKNLAAALESYFMQSEQLATKVYLFAEKAEVYCLFLQVLPSANKKQQLSVWQRIVKQANKIKKKAFADSNLVLLHKLFPEDDIRVFSEQETKFQCSCSRQRSERAVKMMDKEELEQILSEKQVVTVTCEFCNEQYEFDREDVRSL